MPQDRSYLVTGDIEFRGDAAPKFTIEARAFARDLNLQSKPRDGRGTGAWATTRAFRPGGGLILEGRVRDEGFYVPDDWIGEVCDVTLTYNAGKTETLVVRVDGHQVRIEDKEGQDWWRVRLACTILEAPAQAGFEGSQPVAEGQVKSNQELYAGLSKTYDPKTLQTSATVMYEIWPLTDTDAAENTAIAALVATVIASPRFANAKVKTATLLPDRDFDAGTITVNLSLTNTQDDVEMPETGYDVDAGANVIWGQVDVCKVQDDATISWPTTPTQPADLKHGTVDKLQLNDGKWKLTYHFVRNDSTDAIKLPRTKTSSDPSDIGESATIALVTNSSTPPSTPSAPVGQLIGTDTEPVTAANGSYTGYWVHTFQYGPTTNLQAIEFEGGFIVDPSQINDADVITIVADTSTAPSTPSPRVTDLKLVRRRGRRMQGTPEKWAHVFEFGRNTAEDDLETKNSRTGKDPDNFGEEGRVAVLHTSATPPSTPSAPVGQHVGTDIQPLTVVSGSYTGLWLHTFLYATTTRKQEIEQEGGFSIDVGLLDGADVQVLTGSTSTPAATPSARVSNQVLVKTEIRKLQNTPEKWAYRYIFGYRTSVQKLAVSKNSTLSDPDGLDDEVLSGAVYLTASPPADPTPSAGLKLDHKTEYPTDNPLYTLCVYEFRRTTSAERIINQNTFIEEDPAFISGRQQVAGFGAPVSLTGRFVERSTRTQEYNDGKTLYVTEGGYRTTQQDVEFANTATTTDGTTIGGRVTVCTVLESPTPPVSSVTGYRRREVTTKPMTDAGIYEHTEVFTRTTSQEDVEFKGSHIVRGDDSTLGEVRYITAVTTSETPSWPTTPTAPVTLVRYDVRTEQLQALPSPGLWAHTFVFARNTRKTEMERNGTSVTTVTDSIEKEAETTQHYVTASGVPADPSAPAANLQILSRVTQEIDNLNSVRRLKWGLTTPVQRIQYEGGKYRFNQFDNIGYQATTVNAIGVSDLATIAATDRDTYKTDPTVDDIEWEQINPQQYRRTITYIDAYQILEAQSFDDTRTMDAVLVGGTVCVYVAQVVARGSGLFDCYIAPVTLRGQGMRFSLKRRLSSTAVPISLSQTGDRNSGAFLGLPAGYVAYIGGKPRLNRKIATPHVMEECSDFLYSTHGHFTASGIMTGWVTISSNPGVGYKSVGTFGWSGSAAPASDFSGFLA